VARAREPARRDLHGYRTGRPDRGAGHSRRRRRDPAAGGLSASEAGDLHRAPRHAALPAGAHHDPARSPNVSGRHPLQRGPRGTPGGAGSVPARPAGAGAAGHRRRGRRHQPAARPPDGQLRPALEPEPPGTALRPHPPHRPDRGLPPVEPDRRRDPRGRRLPAAAREAGTGPAGGAARSSTCSASWSSKGGRCASCCSTPSATASSRRSARGSTLPSTRALDG